MHKFTVQVEAQMMRRAWNAWVFANGRAWKLSIVSLLITIPILSDLRRGALGTTSVVCLTILAFTILIYVTSYIAGVRRALAKHAALVDGQASYTLTDSTIEASSSLGSISLAWSALSEVRRYHDLILLGFRGANYSTIPAAQIPADALAFLVERARASGAKIIEL